MAPCLCDLDLGEPTPSAARPAALLECTQFDAGWSAGVAATSCGTYNECSFRWFAGRKGMPGKPAKPKPQHAPKAPHEDPKFLESTPARPLRILAEYIQPLARLKRENISDTIVMFGSARIHSREDALARLRRLKPGKLAKTPAAKAKRRGALISAKAALEMSRYYEDCREL